MFVYKVVKYIGSYLMILKKIDAVVLTGGIGEHSKLVQERIKKAIEPFGLKMLIIPTNEELEIAKQAKELISSL